MAWTEVRQRGLALGLGAGLTAAGLWGSVVVLIAVGSAVHAPDRLAMDGDPCCPIPDNWGDVALLSGLGVLAAVLDATALVVGLACLYFAIRHRAPSRGVALLVPAAAGASLGVVVIAQIGPGARVGL